MPFRWNPITSNFDLTEQPPVGTGDVFHADPLTNNKVVLGAGTDFIKVSGIDVDASDNMSNVNTISVNDITTTQQNLDLEPGVDVQVWSAILDQFALLSPTAGDVVYADVDPKWAILPKGADGEVLKLVSGFPSWEPDATGGDVVGPASAVDGNLASYDGTTGKLIADSGIPLTTVLVDGDIGVNVQDYSAILDQFAALSPAEGDLIFGNGTPEWATLAISSEGKKLVVDSGLPAWVDDNFVSNSVGFQNLGLFYSAGTATIKGVDGNALSATNPAFVTLNSNVNSGELVTFKITSNYTFDDANGASSIFAGSLFGFDTGDDTSNVTSKGAASDVAGVVFFLHAIADSTDSNLTFMVSPRPINSNTGTIIFNAGSGGADNRFDYLTIESVTIGDYQNVNALFLGTFLAGLNGSDDWVISNVAPASNFGIGKYYTGTVGIPAGTKGATANSFFIDNGGTAPTVNMTSSRARFKIDPFGQSVSEIYELLLTGSPSGAADARLITANKGGMGSIRVFSSAYIQKTGSGEIYPIVLKMGEGLNGFRYDLLKADGTSAKWQYDDFDAGDTIFITNNYPI